MKSLTNFQPFASIGGRWRSKAFIYNLCVLLAAISFTSASASASSATVTADFGSRFSTAYPIPPNLFGVGLGGALHPETLPLLTGAGLTYTRFHALMQNVYANSTPDWTALDQELGSLALSNMHVILEMDYTPPSLQSTANACANGAAAYYGAPTNVATLAAMATAYVRHIDQKFPGLVLDYEIWNEPDGGGLCTASNTNAEKLSTYLDIFAALAPAIHNAAAKDGATVRTGGPTLGGPVSSATSWISALTTDQRTAPYVNFVSFHYYVSGAADVANGLSWNGDGNTPSLLAMTQSTANTGFANVYKAVAAAVQAGSQPNAATTPIYLDEYNSDWAFVNDCCRNSPTYSPVWNAMVFADLLNTVYDGAFEVPSKILYYAASNHPFCIAGTYDDNMDCVYPSSAFPTPYPQYYALSLFSSVFYLGLQNGGYMAKSVSSSDPNLVSTAFWTAGGDTIVMVNPTSSSYSNVAIKANHPNIPLAHGTIDLLNSGNPAITTESVNIYHTAVGYAAYVDVPAYSVVAVTVGW